MSVCVRAMKIEKREERERAEAKKSSKILVSSSFLSLFFPLSLSLSSAALHTFPSQRTQPNARKKQNAKVDRRRKKTKRKRSKRRAVVLPSASPFSPRDVPTAMQADAKRRAVRSSRAAISRRHPAASAAGKRGGRGRERDREERLENWRDCVCMCVCVCVCVKGEMERERKK